MRTVTLETWYSPLDENSRPWSVLHPGETSDFEDKVSDTELSHFLETTSAERLPRLSGFENLGKIYTDRRMIFTYNM